MKTIIEPFRMKVIEPIRMTSWSERERLIREVHFNLFAIHSEDVLIDLLTDSGTGAMSANQWGALMRGDESYAGSPSFYRFQAAVQRLMPFRHIIPTHQGRAAEAILFSILGGEGRIVPSNTHFDTTRGNIEASGAEALDLPTPEARDFASLHPFKGNMDVAALEALLAARSAEIPLIMITMTNNAGGGQPVSLENLRAVHRLARAFGKTLGDRWVPLSLPKMPSLSISGKFRLRRSAHSGDRTGDLLARRRHDHERKEGRAGQHWGLAGAQRR